jgi:hypothetical protein
MTPGTGALPQGFVNQGYIPGYSPGGNPYANATGTAPSNLDAAQQQAAFYGATPTPGAPNPASPYNQLIQQVLGSVAPTIAETNIGVGAAKAQYGQQVAGIQASQAYQQQQYNLSAIQNLLQGKNIGLEQQQNTLAGQLATQLQNLNTQQFGITGKQFGITTQQSALQQQALREQQAQNVYGYQTGRQNQQAANLATGVVGGGAQKQALTTLAKQYGWTTADIRRAERQTALQQQAAALGYKGAALAYKGQTEQYLTGQKYTAIQRQTLNNLAAANGVSLEQLQNQLSYGMDQLGIQGRADKDQLLQTMADGIAQNDQTKLNALAYVALLGGINLGAATKRK